MSFVGAVEDFLHKLRRNKIYAFAIAYDEIARHYRHTTNAHRDIDAGQHHVANRRRVRGAEICGHVDLGKSIQIANAAIDHQPCAASGFHHIEEEIVADEGSVHLLAEKVDDQHVAGLQHVDGGLIHQALESVLFGLGLCNIVHVGPRGDELV